MTSTGSSSLHPLDAVSREEFQQLGVDREQLVEPLDRGVRAVDGLAERQEGDRADDHRAGRNPLCASLFQLGEDLGRVEGESGVGADLGHQVVVVGVEPLGHLQRRDVVVPAGRREVPVQVVGDARDPGGQRAEQHGGVEHWS